MRAERIDAKPQPVLLRVTSSSTTASRRHTDSSIHVNDEEKSKTRRTGWPLSDAPEMDKPMYVCRVQRSTLAM